MFVEPRFEPPADSIDPDPIRRAVDEIAGHDDGTLAGVHDALYEVGRILATDLAGEHLAGLGQAVNGVVAEPQPRLARDDAQIYRDQNTERAIRPGQGMEQVGTSFTRGAHERGIPDHHLAGLDGIREEAVLVRRPLDAETQDQAADREIVEPRDDRQCPAPGNEITRELADGHAGLDPDDAPTRIDRQDIVELDPDRIVSNPKALASRGGKMVICQPDPMVRRVLETTGTDAIIPLYDDVDSAHQALKPP